MVVYGGWVSQHMILALKQRQAILGCQHWKAAVWEAALSKVPPLIPMQVCVGKGVASLPWHSEEDLVDD